MLLNQQESGGEFRRYERAAGVSSTQVGHFKVRESGWGGGVGVTAKSETGAKKRWESCTLVSQVVVGVGSGRCKNVSAGKSKESQ